MDQFLLCRYGIVSPKISHLDISSFDLIIGRTSNKIGQREGSSREAIGTKRYNRLDFMMEMEVY